jgi:hypothetical protein
MKDVSTLKKDEFTLERGRNFFQKRPKSPKFRARKRGVFGRLRPSKTAFRATFQSSRAAAAETAPRERTDRRPGAGGEEVAKRIERDLPAAKRSLIVAGDRIRK